MLLLATARVLDDGAGQPAHLAVVEFVERQEQGLEVGVLEVGRGEAARLDYTQGVPRLGAIAHADLWACMECCTFLARGGVRSCCGEGLLCPVRARDIAHARSVHLRTACVRPCGPPCAPLSWFLCQALAHQDRRSGGERGAKSIGAGPLGEQDSANCGSGRRVAPGRRVPARGALTFAHHAERGELAQKGEKVRARGCSIPHAPNIREDLTTYLPTWYIP